ncbi:universal stress protein [Croceitalea sp. MTPC9]|uniref:universal stress protein n=1 Tax=unclassified Croceitalea TaxID=2632280 RepID=UPI002B367365|nr:universal stress protein [Croceitalea sp. MTPC6]GMN17997.1 universal stress protein [Croceitalea sp. MTPC9]
MENILIPTDFSDNAWNAIEYATQVLKKDKCIFYILHVHPITKYSDGDVEMHMSSEELEKIFLKGSEENFKRLRKKIERLPLNIKHTFHTQANYDFVTDRIKSEVSKKNIDLIIMGTKGASGLKSVSIGSTTGSVMTKVKCPVLAVPENAEYRRPKEIAFPTDYNLNYDARVLEGIKGFVLMNKSTIRFLYLSKVGEELTNEQRKNQEFLGEYFRGIEHSFHIVTGKRLETAVQCFTESRDIDIIVMVAKNLNFLQRILFKPRVEKISYHIKIPFLVLHE